MTTLAQLQTRCRDRADMEGSFISDSELTSYINASYAELYDLLVAAYEDYFITGPTSFSLTSSDNGVYALPSDFYKLKAVDFLIGGEYATIYPYDWNRRNQFTQATLRSRAYDFRVSYRIIGTNLRLEPRDDATGDYQLWYVPSYTALSDDTDVINTTISRNNWEEYIVIDCAIKMLAKEESNTAHFEKEKRAMIDRIESMSGERDVDQPERVSDVSNRSDDTWWSGY